MPLSLSCNISKSLEPRSNFNLSHRPCLDANFQGGSPDGVSKLSNAKSDSAAEVVERILVTTIAVESSQQHALPQKILGVFGGFVSDASHDLVVLVEEFLAEGYAQVEFAHRASAASSTCSAVLKYFSDLRPAGLVVIVGSLCVWNFW